MVGGGGGGVRGFRDVEVKTNKPFFAKVSYYT